MNITAEDWTKKYYVDIPQLDTDEWKNVATFKTKKAAIKFAKKQFGADDEGKVSLISRS